MFNGHDIQLLLVRPLHSKQLASQGEHEFPDKNVWVGHDGKHYPW